MEDKVKHIGVVLLPDVEELDAIGPWEVLSYWTRTVGAENHIPPDQATIRYSWMRPP